MKHFILALLIFLASPAQADAYESLLQLKDGQTLMNLSATERREVRQDLLSATLIYRAENKDPRSLQNEINTAMNKALKTAEPFKTLQISTLSYRINEYDPNRGKKNMAPAPIWRGEQNLLIKGTDSDKVIALTQKLQDQGLMMQGLTYSVSPALREQTHNDLLEVTLQALKEKAQRAGKALGKTQVSFLKINVGSAPIFEAQPRMVMSAMVKGVADSVAPPAASAGYSDITLSVDATAVLLP